MTKQNGYKIFEELEESVIQWAFTKGILGDYSMDRRLAQLSKFEEEASEFMHEVESENPHAIRDELGDVLVTLIIQANLWGLSLSECLEEAYEKISARSGQMIDGVFVKDE